MCRILFLPCTFAPRLIPCGVRFCFNDCPSLPPSLSPSLPPSLPQRVRSRPHSEARHTAGHPAVSGGRCHCSCGRLPRLRHARAHGRPQVSLHLLPAALPRGEVARAHRPCGRRGVDARLQEVRIQAGGGGAGGGNFETFPGALKCLKRAGCKFEGSPSDRRSMGEGGMVLRGGRRWELCHPAVSDPD